MKLVFLSLALFTATIMSAQKFEIGLNGGIGFNTKPGIISESNEYASATMQQSGSSFVTSLKAMIDHNKWQYGLQVDDRQLAYSTKAYFGFTPIIYPPEHKVFISKVAIPFKAFVNREIILGHFENYAGISVGYLLATKCEDPYALAEKYYDHVNGNGITIGIQVGSTYFITNHIGINAEINGDYMLLTIGGATYRLFDFPGTIGIRYKF